MSSEVGQHLSQDVGIGINDQWEPQWINHCGDVFTWVRLILGKASHQG